MVAMSESGATSNAAFDGLSGEVAARVMARVNADMERAAVALAQLADGDRILVIGCGPGVGVVGILDAVVPAAGVLAIDPSAVMVRAAKRRAGRHGRGQLVQFEQISALPSSRPGPSPSTLPSR